MLFRSGAVIAISVLVHTSAAQANADTVGQYVSRMSNDDVSRRIIGELGDGLGWANATLHSKKQTPLYCEPGNLALTEDQYWSILETYLIKHPDQAKHPAVMWKSVFIDALAFTFPCE